MSKEKGYIGKNLENLTKKKYKSANESLLQ